MSTESKPAVHTATLLDRYLADSGLYARCMQFRAATTQAAIERAYDDIKAYKADSHAALVEALRDLLAEVKRQCGDAEWRYGNHPAVQAAVARPGAGRGAEMKTTLLQHVWSYVPKRQQVLVRAPFWRLNSRSACLWRLLRKS